MKNSFLKISLISLMLLGLIHISQALEKDPNADISISIQKSIELQQEVHKIIIPRAAIIPEEENYDNAVNLQEAENIYHVPEVKSTCGFLCGRSQFTYYLGRHPNHDCFSLCERPSAESREIFAHS